MAKLRREVCSGIEGGLSHWFFFCHIWEIWQFSKKYDNLQKLSYFYMTIRIWQFFQENLKIWQYAIWQYFEKSMIYDNLPQSHFEKYFLSSYHLPLYSLKLLRIVIQTVKLSYFIIWQYEYDNTFWFFFKYDNLWYDNYFKFSKIWLFPIWQ